MRQNCSKNIQLTPLHNFSIRKKIIKSCAVWMSEEETETKKTHSVCNKARKI